MRIIPFEPAWLDRVLALRARTYGTEGHGHHERYFRWRHLAAPGGLRPFYLLAVEGEALLGQWAGMVDRLHAAPRPGEGRDIDVVWTMDLVVAPEARDTMAAAALFRGAMTDGRPVLATGVSPDALPFFQGFRWRRMAVVDTFYRVFRPGRLLALAGGPAGGLKATALGGADAVLPRLWQARDRPALPRLWQARDRPALVRVDTLGAEVDALYRDVRERLVVSSVRTAEALRWRLDARPCGAHRTLVLRRPDGGLRGYIVLKLRDRPGIARWGELADFLLDPDDLDGFDALVEGAAAEALALDLDFLRLRTSLPQHGARLRRPWWIRRDRAPMDDLFLWEPRDADVAAALRRRPWFLTSLAGDQVETGLDEHAPLP
ncbi:MAG: hypothetical protein H6742_16765 [Alphaproteobacteria bacterium]|nr:hypothetical protein [Alphaproteobacteria bacterium]